MSASPQELLETSDISLSSPRASLVALTDRYGGDLRALLVGQYPG
ncbi:hypothetical protein [Streptomyces griseus]